MVDALELSFATGLTVDTDVPLGPHTSLKIGGPADFLVRPRSPVELARTLSAAHERQVPWLLLGGGSNMLISDRGFRGLAIKVEAESRHRTRGEVLEATQEFIRLRCAAGTLSAGLARWTASLGWTGLEWACGIPGTIGGAAAGNAGAYGGDMAACVEGVLAWFPDGQRDLDVSELQYGYRASRFKRSSEPAAVLRVDLQLARGSADEALARIAENESRRRANQPTERSCGSVFKNPFPSHAGQLIEESGLKGASVGDVQISLKHGNFFVNKGQGTAADVLALIRMARERVAALHGVNLEVEILFAGQWDASEVADL